MISLVERNRLGRFEASPESLHPKTIGLRLHKSHYDRFYDISTGMGKRPTELAREIIEAWLDRQENEQEG